jgi:ElaB/YqjD/DUF883 family membrane-anchored ribosome-binding protein
LAINVDETGYHHLNESLHDNGRYAKRNEVESLVERINEQIADSTNEVSHLINQMNEIMSESTGETVMKCKLVVDKLESLRKRTKKLKRPRRFREEEIQ